MNLKLIFAIAALTLLWACGEKDEVVNNTITIAGQLTNAEGNRITASLDEELASDSLKDDGSFLLKFDFEETETFTFNAGNTAFTLYLSPGDSIYITADAEEFAETFLAQGDKAHESMYARKKIKASRESGMNDYMKLMAHGTEAYFAKRDSVINVVKAHYETLAEQEGVDPDFLEMEEAYFKYLELHMDYLYPMYHGHITRKHKDSIDFPTEEVKERLNAVPLDQVHLLKVTSYENVIEHRLNDKMQEILEQDSTIKEKADYYNLARWMAADSLISHPQVNDYVKYKIIRDQMSYRGPVNAEEMYQKFMASNTTPKYQESLEKIKAKWEPINPGKDVPDFAFTDIEGNEVKLSDLRGQLVYIDIWATWCGPCIAEHPHWDKVKAEYADKPVAFVTVSIDNTRAPWEKMVKEKKMDGYQWFAENAWQSELTQHFMVNGIPRFLLLDAEGKIIDPSADRPSGPIREKLDKHLEELS